MSALHSLESQSLCIGLNESLTTEGEVFGGFVKVTKTDGDWMSVSAVAASCQSSPYVSSSVSRIN